MSEIQNSANIEWIKYIFGVLAVLAGFVNILLIYIFKLIKKDINKLKTDRELDHDRLTRVEAEQTVLHKDP